MSPMRAFSRTCAMPMSSDLRATSVTCFASRDVASAFGLSSDAIEPGAPVSNRRCHADMRLHARTAALYGAAAEASPISMKAAVVQFPGSNADWDALHALRDVVGVQTEYV